MSPTAIAKPASTATAYRLANSLYARGITATAFGPIIQELLALLAQLLPMLVSCIPALATGAQARAMEGRPSDTASLFHLILSQRSPSFLTRAAALALAGEMLDDATVNDPTATIAENMAA